MPKVALSLFFLFFNYETFFESVAYSYLGSYLEVWNPPYFFGGGAILVINTRGSG